MFFHALVLAAVVDPCAQAEAQTQMAANLRWARQADTADKALNASYRKVTAAMHASNVDSAPLVHVQLDWITARDKTCDYAGSLYEGGSIVPAVYAQCLAETTAARTNRLDNLLDSIKSGKLGPSGPVDANVDAKLNRVYEIILKHVDAKSRSSLIASEAAWLTYRDAACAIEGSDCLTKLEEQRIELLESSWYPDCDGELPK